MAEQVLTDAKVWAGQYDFSGSLNSVALSYGADTPEKTSFGDDTHVMIAGGLKTLEIQEEGFVDETAGVGTIFGNLALANIPMSFSATGGAENDIAFFVQAMFATYSPGGSTGDINAFSVAASANDSLIRGVVIANEENAIASGDSTGFQLGAIAAGEELQVAIHVLAGSGTLDIDIVSDDNSGFTTEVVQLSATQATGATSEYLTLAGPVTDDWWRANWTIGGGSPDFTFIVVIGIK